MYPKSLLLRIIQEKPQITTYRIAKLAYLFDLACVQVYSQPKSKIPFNWGLYGPYCLDIEKIIGELEDEGKITREHAIITGGKHKGQECVVHSAIENQKTLFSDLDEQIFSYVIKKYSNLSFDELNNFVYATPPMKKAQEKGKRFRQLDLKEKTGMPDVFFDSSFVRKVLNTHTKKTEEKLIPLEEVWNKVKNHSIPRG